MRSVRAVEILPIAYGCNRQLARSRNQGKRVTKYTYFTKTTFISQMDILTRKIKAHLPILLSAGAGVVGVMLYIIGTSLYGPGLSPDSIAFASAAERIARTPSLILGPSTLFPPLYPTMMGVAELSFGVEPLVSGHVFNGLAFGITLFLSGLIAHQLFEGKRSLAITGLLAITFAAPLFMAIVFCTPKHSSFACLHSSCGNRCVIPISPLGKL